MSINEQLSKELEKKKKRKAVSNGKPKLLNIPRNWVHQGLSYMDSGELIIKIIVETLEVAFIYFCLIYFLEEASELTLIIISFFLVHTWNWVTNGLFWTVIIFSFPNLKNPGAIKTEEYLIKMKNRIKKEASISAVAVYGSVARSMWHDRSDIDLRFLRKPGFLSLIQAGKVTMRERFIALICKQPMDLFLADDVDFLEKMRSDEIPVFLKHEDKRLDRLYPGSIESEINLMSNIK